MFVEWLTANPDAQQRYLAVKRDAERAGDTLAGYVAAKEVWFHDAYREAWAWADATNWRPTE